MSFISKLELLAESIGQCSLIHECPIALLSLARELLNEFFPIFVHIRISENVVKMSASIGIVELFERERVWRSGRLNWYLASQTLGKY